MNSPGSPINGKILSIIYIYNNCDRMLPEDYRTSKLTSYGPDEKILYPFTKGNITLFKLTGKYSPFQQQLIWPFDINPNLPQDKATKGVTTDYFQYMISIKNAKATTPLNK